MVPYTLTATDALGQSASAAGTLNCDLIPATVLASTGPLGDASDGALQYHATGWHFTPGAAITLCTMRSRNSA